MERIVKLALVILLLATTTQAMNILDALSMIESGNNDKAVGKAGEVSRYQIRPSVWRAQYREPMNPANPVHARLVASRILANRIHDFRFHQGCAPTTMEKYLLWRCPFRVLKPTKADLAIARRFANLVESKP